jgi:hypothetical protein
MHTLICVNAQLTHVATTLALVRRWMSWEIFRCDTNCQPGPASTSKCIDHRLYESMTDALVSGGFLAAGYDGM